MVFEVGKFVAERGNFVFQVCDALEASGGSRRFRRRQLGGGRLQRRFVDVAGEKMGVTGFFGAGLAGKDGNERRIALHQQI